MLTVIFILVMSFLLIYVLAKNPKSHPQPETTTPQSNLENGMPFEFDGATIVMNETSISTDVPVPLDGRIDQLFKLTDGTHIIVDTKIRSSRKAYPNDRLELSAYATILQSKGIKLRPYAYIRIPVHGENRSTWHPVPLWSSQEVSTFYYRYWNIRDNLIPPICTCGRH